MQSWQYDVIGMTITGKKYGMSLSQPPTYRLFSMDRVVLSSFPSPAPPAFKNPCSPTHVANAIALLTTAMFGGVPRDLRR